MNQKKNTGHPKRRQRSSQKETNEWNIDLSFKSWKTWNLIQIIDAILLIAMIAVVLWVHYQGFYVNKEIIIQEVCNGAPTGIPYLG